MCCNYATLPAPFIEMFCGGSKSATDENDAGAMFGVFLSALSSFVRASFDAKPNGRRGVEFVALRRRLIHAFARRARLGGRDAALPAEG